MKKTKVTEKILSKKQTVFLNQLRKMEKVMGKLMDLYLVESDKVEDQKKGTNHARKDTKHSTRKMAR